MADVNTFTLGEHVYDAVEVTVAQVSARGCEGCDNPDKGKLLCRKFPPCAPIFGRTDGRFVVWKRRLAKTRGEVANG